MSPTVLRATAALHGRRRRRRPRTRRRRCRRIPSAGPPVSSGELQCVHTRCCAKDGQSSPARSGRCRRASNPVNGCGSPGRWSCASRGIHACTADQLPQWLGSEIWEVELGGEIVSEGPALLSSQARLRHRLEQWDADAQSRFALDCAERARAVIAPLSGRRGAVHGQDRAVLQTGDGGRGRLLDGAVGRRVRHGPASRTRLRHRVRRRARRAGRVAQARAGRWSADDARCAQSGLGLSALNASTSDSMTGSGTSCSRSAPLAAITARIWSR